MQPRIKNTTQAAPGALDALLSFAKVVEAAAANAGIPRSTVDLVELRASQFNGCAVCLDMHSRAARKHGISDQQLNTAAAWRESPYFDEAQRAALALAEAGTRLADHTQVRFWSTDIDNQVKALADRGVVFDDYDTPTFKTVNHIATTPVGRSAWFKDPDGNTIAIFQPA